MPTNDNRPKKEKAWERHERRVAAYINELLPPGWKASRPVASVKYSDVKIIPPRGSRLPDTWVEVKMSHSDNLFNARPSYIGGKFVYTTVDSAVKEFVIEEMSTNSQVTRFIINLGKFLGRDNFDILSTQPGSLPNFKSNAGRLKLANEETIQAYNAGLKWSSVKRTDPRPVVSWYEFKDFFTKHPGGQTFADLLPAGSATEFTEKATTHYNDGKATPVHYIQTGNDFYFMGDTGDPLGLGIAIPIWSAKGNFKIRISLGKNEKVDDRGGRTEIMPELKAESVVHTSAFSCDYRRGNKRNPFEIPWEIYQYNL